MTTTRRNPVTGIIFHVIRLNYMFIDLRLKLNLAPGVQNLHISLSFSCTNSGPCKTIEISLDVIPDL